MGRVAWLDGAAPTGAARKVVVRASAGARGASAILAACREWGKTAVGEPAARQGAEVME
jgi:hypothetical protein